MQLPITRDLKTIQSPAGESPGHVDLDREGAYRVGRRFDRAARLFSEGGLARLAQSRVVIIGVGGVGSFAAEALARSGVGTLCLVDFDRVCITNTNRQLHAMQGTVGREKVAVMAERLRAIHPTGKVEALQEIYSPASADQLLSGQVDYVIDAIDALGAKTHLIATCVAQGIPLVTAMGAAAKMDPTQVQVADVMETYNDPLALFVRKKLRQDYGLALGKKSRLGVQAVFSPEEPVLPSLPHYDEGDGFRCICPGGKEGRADCDHRKRIDGTASFVTGTFGLVAASVVVRALIDVPFRSAERHGGSTVRGSADAEARARREARAGSEASEGDWE
jgi:tRNA threonylcarbamoyladenosine dehydratase